MPKRLELIGQRFGRLTVISLSGIKKYGDKSNQYTLWECLCDCGAIKQVVGATLRSGKTISCGCYHKEDLSKTLKGKPSRTRKEFGLASAKKTYNAYIGAARQRNLEWNLSFEQYLDIVCKDCYYCGVQPSNICKSKTYNGEFVYTGIDRVDNDSGYYADNIVPCCRMCNASKRNYTQQEFLKWALRLADNIRAKQLLKD
jgi:hypothetical protein